MDLFSAEQLLVKSSVVRGVYSSREPLLFTANTQATTMKSKVPLNTKIPRQCVHKVRGPKRDLTTRASAKPPEKTVIFRHRPWVKMHGMQPIPERHPTKKVSESSNGPKQKSSTAAHENQSKHMVTGATGVPARIPRAG